MMLGLIQKSYCHICDIYLKARIPAVKAEARALRKKGTWAYMAPETFEDVVTPKIDIWALGVVPQRL